MGSKKINEGTCSFKYASDFYHHYKEDIALMAEMGFKMFRMSFHGQEFFPEGEGKINQAGINYYKNVFKRMSQI
ncbi:MAG: family 1 glycosylhydrolase [Holdemanella porci]